MYLGILSSIKGYKVSHTSHQTNYSCNGLVNTGIFLFNKRPKNYALRNSLTTVVLR